MIFRNIKAVFPVMAAACLLAACNRKASQEIAPVKYYAEQYRPVFHFSPDSGWMNDPNGMVYHAGEYHLFYQHYPDSNVWGPMHWGHAVSRDMIHWSHLPVALYPDSLGMIFSGSAVMDMKNTSGLGSDENPAMVAIFTFHNAELEKGGSDFFQSQGLAYSTDKGRNWTKFAGNPVLKNPGIRDFRDPKVLWHQATGKWIMILAVQDRVHLYSSPNLTEWKYESEFGKGIGAHGGVWECPDLFPLETSQGKTKWVMLVSINPGGPNGGSATQYFVGDFDGHRFNNETSGVQWLDWGRDNYAGVTWSGIPEADGRRILLGWMSNWQYANRVPTYVWRSAMTLPRELTLTGEGKHYSLASNPVKEFEALRKGGVILPSLPIRGEAALPTDSINISQAEVILDFRLGNAPVDSIGIILENGLKERFFISYNPMRELMVADRSKAGSNGFSEYFSQRAVAPFRAGERLQFRMIIDASSIELFVDRGKIVMTNLVFPSQRFDRLKVFSSGGEVTLEKAELYNLENIWLH